MPRNTRAIIHLDNIAKNYQLANKWAAHSKNIAVIKADAYGHGLLPVAKYLEKTVTSFAVAIFEEAAALRENGITKDILVLQGINSAEDLLRASQLDLSITVHQIEQLDIVINTPLEKPIKLWLKLDTGMHRLGLSESQLITALEKLKSCRHIDRPLVISSHFSSASDTNSQETAKQIRRFNEMNGRVKLPEDTQYSLANSPAIVGYPESNLDWNRPGIMLYGLPLFDVPHKSDQQLSAAMTFESEIISLRQISKGDCVGYNQQWCAENSSLIATIAVGYADGYPRQASNGTPVLINGKRAKLVGTVSMDLISVDVSNIKNVAIGDSVELWGNRLCANEVARFSGTIGYDLISGVSKRVPRIYQE